MRDYSKVSPAFWTRGSGKKLRGNAAAQVVALYLATCPSSNMVGLYYVPLVTVAHETGLSVEAATEALAATAKAGFAFFDTENEIAWVPNMAEYQIGEQLKAGDKRRGMVLAQLDQAGDHPFVLEFWAKYQGPYALGRCPVKGHRRGIEGASCLETRTGRGITFDIRSSG